VFTVSGWSSAVAEGNWNQPDPSGPAWASQWDYYQGAAAALQRGDAQPPPPLDVKHLRRVRRKRKLLGIAFAVLAAWFAIGSINYAVTGSKGYLIGGLIFTGLFALFARWLLRSAHRLRMLEADGTGRLESPAAPVGR
jgi:hypothetical protein